ncbi:MAG: FAD-dependent oxidoreductase [Actinomycetota bacterium]
MRRFDAIVVGGGATGTAVARSLAGRDREVLLLERFSIGHDRGSSGGPTRIFRLTYEDPGYVRMARLALERWRALEDEAGERLLITTSGLDVGTEGRRSAEALWAAGESCDYRTADEIAERWPHLYFARDAEIFEQSSGGVCLAAATVRAQARVANELGATILEGTIVERITPQSDDGVEVVTPGETFGAPVAVLAAGSWAGPLLTDAGRPLALRPSLEQVTYFRSDAPQILPTVIDWTVNPPSTPYLVPDPTEPGAFKVALHMSGPAADPDRRSFDPDPVRVEKVRDYTADVVRGSHPTGVTHTCLYTNTPDEDFVLDRIGPLVIGSPCSGHGFKFTPLIGDILADLATGGAPPVDLTRFSAARDTLRI